LPKITRCPKDENRRKFLGNTAAIGAITTLGVAGLASACSNETTKNIVIPVPLLVFVTP